MDVCVKEAECVCRGKVWPICVVYFPCSSCTYYRFGECDLPPRCNYFFFVDVVFVCVAFKKMRKSSDCRYTLQSTTYTRINTFIWVHIQYTRLYGTQNLVFTFNRFHIHSCHGRLLWLERDGVARVCRDMRARAHTRKKMCSLGWDLVGIKRIKLE